MSKNKTTNKHSKYANASKRVSQQELDEYLAEQEVEQERELTEEELNEVEERQEWLDEVTQADEEKLSYEEELKLLDAREKELAKQEEEITRHLEETTLEERGYLQHEELFPEIDEEDEEEIKQVNEEEKPPDDVDEPEDTKRELTVEDKKAITLAKMGFIAIAFVGLTFLILVLCIVGYNHSKNQQTIEIQSNYQTVATDWVSNFVKGKFEDCDKYVMEQYRIVTHDNDKSYDYYIYALKQLGASTRSIEVEKGESTEYGDTYTIKLTYNPFKQIDKLELNKELVKQYKELEEKYVKGEGAESEIKELLNDITDKAYYENCFQIDEDNTKTEVFVLYEDVRGADTEEDGITEAENTEEQTHTYVQGTSRFIDLFLEDSNLTNNINVYQSQITKTIENMINDN